MRTANSEVLPVTTSPAGRSDNIFRFSSLSFATALCAAGLLEYLGVDRDRKTRNVEFLFKDPNNIGSELMRRFNAGVFPNVNAKLYAEMRGFFIAELNRAKAGAADDQK